MARPRKDKDAPVTADKMAVLLDCKTLKELSKKTAIPLRSLYELNAGKGGQTLTQLANITLMSLEALSVNKRKQLPFSHKI